MRCWPYARFSKLPDELKRMAYFIAALLIQVGIFSTRWNVVIGGQLFSKSLRGLTVYKMELLGEEGLLMVSGLPDPALRDPLRAREGPAALGRGSGHPAGRGPRAARGPRGARRTRGLVS